MINAIQSKNLLPLMQKYMFTKQNILQGYNSKTTSLYPVPVPVSTSFVPTSFVPTSFVASPLYPVPLHVTLPVPKHKIEKQNKPFTPFQKDKLFWCFFILLKGHEEYEMNKTNSFSLEKKIKIEAVEKLKSIKEKLKELKLKRTELEDNLVNQPTISVKGLYALCLVHNISITYIYGRKYCEINPESEQNNTIKKGVIIQNDKKEDSLQWNDDTDEFMKNIRENYWFIENVQKPLNASSAYTLKELQDICQKLQIGLETTVNDKTKIKTKTTLYQEILAHI
jgi:hypothetical protein